MTGSGTDTRWPEVDALFREALDLSPADREDVLARTALRDPDLASRVRALLRAMDQAGSFLEDPPTPPPPGTWKSLLSESGGDGGDENAEDPRIGERVGAYELVRRLGRGGMATVYEAERADGEWNQRVAVKLIRRGLDTEDVVRRFRAERQILSTLRHPNIARLLDGGTTDDGLPYLVMELVRGRPLLEHCDQLRLGVRRRLEIFVTVCRAVQHAHGSLVIHRDLKPSNILVDEDGAPRLLDFGIAKVLAPDPSDDGHTRTGHRFLTPEYASPEQARGEGITTASDVYQLGVLLSVLVSGARPRATADGADGRERPWEDVRPPSRQVTPQAAAERGTTATVLARRLRGDLDSIVLKAVSERPEGRYNSVEALADDVERSLQGRAIVARPPTWGYRAGKLVRRKPWLAPAIVASLVAIIGYGVTLQRHARALEVERNTARAQAERAEAVQGFLVDVFASPDPYADTARTDITVRQALDLGVRRIEEELAGRPVLQAALFGAVADVYTNLGLGPSALPLHQTALELGSAHGDPDAPEMIYRRRMLGRTLLESDRPDSALKVLEGALAAARRSPGTPDTTVVKILSHLGRAERFEGHYDRAEQWFREALATVTEADSAPDDLRASVHYQLALLYPQLNDTERALEHARSAYDLSLRSLGEDHATTAIVTLGLADALHHAGEEEASTDLYRTGIERITAVFGLDHPNVFNARNNLALRLRDRGDLEGSLAEFLELYRLESARYGDDSQQAAARAQNLATVLQRMGRPDEAEEWLERAHRAFVASMPAGHYLTAFPLLTLSGIQLDRADFPAASRTSREALDILRAGLPEDHYARAVSECRLGRSLLGLGRADEARTLLLEAARKILGAPVTPEAYQLECLKAAEELSAAEVANGLATDAEMQRIRERLTELAAQVPSSH